MKKAVILLIKTFFVIMVIWGIISYGIYWLFFDLETFSTGELLCESTSPDGRYTIKAYSSGMMFSPESLKCKLTDNKTKKVKTIYWGYRESSAEITWENDNTVIINGRKLKLPKDTYDSRRKSSSADGSQSVIIKLPQ